MTGAHARPAAAQFHQIAAHIELDELIVGTPALAAAGQSGQFVTEIRAERCEIECVIVDGLAEFAVFGGLEGELERQLNYLCIELKLKFYLPSPTTHLAELLVFDFFFILINKIQLIHGIVDFY